MRLINVLIQEMSVFRSQKVTLIKYYLEAVAMHHLSVLLKCLLVLKMASLTLILRSFKKLLVYISR
jgi:hypothetical protein